MEFSLTNWAEINRIAKKAGMSPNEVIIYALSVYEAILDSFNHTGDEDGELRIYGKRRIWRLSDTYFRYNSIRRLLGLKK